MDQIQRLNSEIIKFKAEHEREVNRQVAQCHTLIDAANEDLRVNSERITAVKENLLKEKTKFESNYRERLQQDITESQIEFNFNLIPKVIRKEIQISELPSSLHPLVNIYTLIQRCNEERLEAIGKFKAIQSEQTTKLENIIPTLRPAFEARLIELLKQLSKEMRLFHSRIKSEIIDLEPKQS